MPIDPNPGYCVYLDTSSPVSMLADPQGNPVHAVGQASATSPCKVTGASWTKIQGDNLSFVDDPNPRDNFRVVTVQANDSTDTSVSRGKVCFSFKDAAGKTVYRDLYFNYNVTQ